MRVAVVTTSFPRTEEDPSGHFVRSSAQALASAGHDVHVVASSHRFRARPEMRGALAIHHAGGGELFAWPGAIARAREAPWRAYQIAPFAMGVLYHLNLIGPIDCAIAHWILPNAWPLMLSIRAPLQIFAHGADVRALVAIPQALRTRIIRDLLERQARFSFVAGALLESLATSLPHRTSVELRKQSCVEPPPIHIPNVEREAEAIRNGLQLARGEHVVAVVGRLIRTKRVALAIDAVAKIGPAVRLLVIGDGPERSALERYASERGGNVVFTGALPRAAALAWMGASDVLLHPSMIEAAPSVVREARALRIPVIACRAGDIEAWSKDDPGIKVVEGDAEAFASALAELF